MSSPTISNPDLTTGRWKFWRAATVVLLFLGYGGYYFCRADLSVAMPLLIADLVRQGMSSRDATVQVGTISSFGVLAYALGKFVLAGMADFFGGRRNFLLGMAGSIFFTVLFTLAGGLPIFTLAWVGNRLVQSGGWGGLVKVTSKWFSYSSYGTVIGILSISYLVGDAAARGLLGAVLRQGYGWRALFYTAAVVLGVVLVLNALFLKESCEEVGEPRPEVNPLNLYAETSDTGRPGGVWSLVRPMLSSNRFLVVCVLSLGCTLVRESFNTWTPTYFHEAIGYSNSQAAEMSALFPLVGVASVLGAGWLSDRLGTHGRAIVMCAGLLFASAALAGLAIAGSRDSRMLTVALVCGVALGLIGPYSYLAGAMALDFGGRRGGAASSGLIDGVGYLGGVLAGGGLANVATAFGWSAAFWVLAGVTICSCAGAGWLARGAVRG